MSDLIKVVNDSFVKDMVVACVVAVLEVLEEALEE
ncbi:hypothetical protein SDC9_116149 [bioreactor metagenome]|uniref:Uncharacterized protein n=1 Tax=bioreactor metagenome TaxID=1076179 RepID=A0A645BVD1_9ZZZZ